MNIGRFFAQVIEVEKEVKHEIFVHDVVPVFRLSIGKNSRAKTPVKRNNSSSCSRPDHAMYFPQPETARVNEFETSGHGI